MVSVKKKLIIALHVYRGNNGEVLAARYLNLLASLLLGHSIDANLFIFFYEFPKTEEHKLKTIFSQAANGFVEANYVFSGDCPSEVPTLRKAKKLCENAGYEDLLVYFHSKGASYQDQERFINWSEYAIAVLAAAILHLWVNPKLLNRYSAIGSFAGVGVFERFGKMTPAFSGNFWLTKANMFSLLDVKEDWYADSYHNRHYAEALLAENISAEKLLNLEDNYHLRASMKSDPQQIFLKVSNDLSELSSSDDEELDVIDRYLRFYYEGLIKQQQRYSQSRIFWNLRKKIFGNDSILRYFSVTSRILDNRFCNWKQCELYRHYNGPKHIDILRSVRSDKLLNGKF